MDGLNELFNKTFDNTQIAHFTFQKPRDVLIKKSNIKIKFQENFMYKKTFEFQEPKMLSLDRAKCKQVLENENEELLGNKLIENKKMTDLLKKLESVVIKRGSQSDFVDYDFVELNSYYNSPIFIDGSNNKNEFVKEALENIKKGLREFDVTTKFEICNLNLLDENETNPNLIKNIDIAIYLAETPRSLYLSTIRFGFDLKVCDDDQLVEYEFQIILKYIDILTRASQPFIMILTNMKSFIFYKLNKVTSDGITIQKFATDSSRIFFMIISYQLHVFQTESRKFSKNDRIEECPEGLVEYMDPFLKFKSFDHF